MPTPTLTPGSIDRQTPRASTAPKLVLEPVRASSQLESYPLAIGRYLLGSSPDCDIVIAVGGVAAQHCLMIVGANKTIVKAISPLTWINDGPLTEAVLKLGERLILGPVELRTRRPEVSEWVELREEIPTPPAAPVAYQPPQIEELLDRALQQLHTAIDDSPRPTPSWSEDLPLTEAVQIHASVVEHAASVPAVPVVQPPALAWMAAERRELEQRALEVGERFRALDYLGSELSTREEQLRSREISLHSLEAQVEQVLTEVGQREQALTAQEHALHVRNEAEAAASRMIAEMTRALEAEQARLRQLEAAVQGQVSELERQAQSLAERTRTLEWQESELALQAESLPQQAHAVQTLAPVSPVTAVDTGEVELREAAVAKREAVLASSGAALQATREQISREAAELEQRFQELLQREQTVLQQQTVLTEQTGQTAARTREAATQIESLAEYEQSVATSIANLTEREASLQKLKAELDGRNRELRGLRSELDIREEALNQQFSQFQQDRSALRASQSKLQLAEQAANQRLVSLESSSVQRSKGQTAELAELRTRLDQDRAESLQERQALEQLRLQIEEQRMLLEQEHSDRVLLTAAEVDQIESDNEWQKLAAERARLAAERRELEVSRLTFQTERSGVRVAEDDSSEVSEQLLALVSERQLLAELREELLREQQSLRVERDEIRRTRTQFDQDYGQLLAIKAESVTERDTYIQERQSVISERQSLQDRERQVKQAEAEISLRRQAAEQLRTEAESGRQQMTTQRVHLEEEWASLRQERAELQRVESDLDSQREELTNLAQQLTDLQAGVEAATPMPVVSLVPPPSPVSSVRSMEQWPVPAAVPSATPPVAAELDSVEEAIDPLAGFASFSSIGSAIEDDLPPEIAEIMRKAAERSPTSSTANKPHGSTLAMAVDAPPSRPASVPQHATIDDREEQRLRDLLGRTSESYVEAATARLSDEPETYEVVEDKPHSVSPMAWGGGPTDEVTYTDSEDVGESEEAPQWRNTASDGIPETAVQSTTPQSGADASELRSRLSAMFGIDLGRLRPPTAQTSHPVEPPVAESDEDQSQSEYSSPAEDVEPDNVDETARADNSGPGEIVEEPTPEPPCSIDESLDPVAAYMEQLLARTRKSKDGHGAKTESSAPKPAPPPVVPVVPKEEPKVQQAEKPAPIPARQSRKLEASDKKAIRANLDSFREIANTQARSDVARSELRRLMITEKVKQIFLAISGGIALILLSTELWTTRHYRLEMTAAMIATAILGYDYYRTKKRLHELELIAPLEVDSNDEAESDEA